MALHLLPIQWKRKKIIRKKCRSVSFLRMHIYCRRTVQLFRKSDAHTYYDSRLNRDQQNSSNVSRLRLRCALFFVTLFSCRCFSCSFSLLFHGRFFSRIATLFFRSLALCLAPFISSGGVCGEHNKLQQQQQQ